MDKDIANLVSHGLLQVELMKSEKYREFIDINYTIQFGVDDESKEVTVQVVENPPEVVMSRLATKANLVKEKKIEIASEFEAKKIVSDAEAKAKSRKRKT